MEQVSNLTPAMNSYAIMIHEAGLYREMVFVMSDIAIIAASAKTAIVEIGKQAAALAMGLQNVAPGDKTGAPNNSILYLFEVSKNLAQVAEECEKFLGFSPDEQDTQHEP